MLYIPCPAVVPWNPGPSDAPRPLTPASPPRRGTPPILRWTANSPQRASPPTTPSAAYQFPDDLKVRLCVSQQSRTCVCSVDITFRHDFAAACSGGCRCLQYRTPARAQGGQGRTSTSRTVYDRVARSRAEGAEKGADRVTVLSDPDEGSPFPQGPRPASTASTSRPASASATAAPSYLRAPYLLFYHEGGLPTGGRRPGGLVERLRHGGRPRRQPSSLPMGAGTAAGCTTREAAPSPPTIRGLEGSAGHLAASPHHRGVRALLPEGGMLT